MVGAFFVRVSHADAFFRVTSLFPESFRIWGCMPCGLVVETLVTSLVTKELFSAKNRKERCGVCQSRPHQARPKTGVASGVREVYQAHTFSGTKKSADHLLFMSPPDPTPSADSLSESEDGVGGRDKREKNTDVSQNVGEKTKNVRARGVGAGLRGAYR